MQRALAGTRGVAADAGRQAGLSFGNEFQKAFNDSMRGVNDQMAKMSKDATKAVESNFKPELARIMDGEASKIENRLDEAGDKGGARFTKRATARITNLSGAFQALFGGVDRAAGDGGDRAGNTFSRRFSTVVNSSVGKSAIQAANSFAKLYGSLAAGGTAIAGLVGGISALVSGLYLLATAAASAGASLIALGGLLGGLIQGGIALAIAFKGVFGAISSGMKAAGADTGATAAATVAAARRIADARARIAEVQIRNAQRLEDANDRVADAERGLTRAQQNALNAQQKLNAAREEAAQDLEDLGFAVEDAALNERRALLRLEEARDELAKAQALPEGSKARDEAQLAYDEAAFAAKMATKNLLELAAEQEAADAAGVEGSGKVVDAKNDVIDANNAIAEAENELARTRQEAAEVAADADRDLAKARLDLARATEDASAAQSKASSEANKYNEALQKLSPSAKEFVTYLVGMRDEFAAFKRAVQEPFFDEFNRPFREMVETLLPIAQTGLAGTSRVMGLLAAQFAGALTNNAEQFGAALEFNNSILAKFSEETATGNSAIGNMVDVMFRLLEAIKPVTEVFTDWLVGLTESVALATDSASEMDTLTGFFDRAGRRMALFGEIFGAVFSLFGTLSRAAGAGIQNLLVYFRDSFEGMNQSAEENIGELGMYFFNVSENIKPILDLLGQLSLVFLSLGAAPELGESFEILQGVVEPLKQIMADSLGAGPALANLVVSVVELLAAFSESGALTVFFDTLNGIVSAAVALAGSPIGQWVITTLGPMLAAFKALSLVFMGFQFVTNIMLGSILKLASPFMAVIGFFQQAGGVGMGLRIVMLTLRTAFAAMLGPVGLIIGAIAILIPVFVKLYKENESFRAAIDSLIDTFMTLVKTLIDALMPIVQMVIELFMELAEALMPVVAMIIETLVPIIVMLVDVFLAMLVPAIKVIAVIFKVVFDIIIALLKNVILPAFTLAFKLMIIPLQLLMFWIETLFSFIKIGWDRWGQPALDSIMVKWESFKDGASERLQGVKDKVSEIFESIQKLWNKYGQPAIDAVKNAIETFKNSIAGGDGPLEAIKKAFKALFDGLWGVAKEPLNSLIKNINKYLIDNLNKVTKPFGLTISQIPTFADGGPVKGKGGPRSDSILARVSNGEYVMKASSVKKFGQSTFDALNNGRFPTGGLSDWAEGAIDGLKGVGSGILDLIKSGPAKAMMYLFNKTVGPMASELKGDDRFLVRLAGSVIEKLGEALNVWAGKKQDAYDDAQTSSGSVPPYTGPPGGWTYPLSRRYPGKNWPGHSPYWAIDIASPTGTGVRAASAGVVAVMRNLGDRSYGRYIVLSHAGGKQTLYAHLDAFKTKQGATVKTGDLIGLSGNSGGSRGPHLHFELKPGSDTIRGMAALGVKLASGGTVRATPGGVLALLAEGGRHERVEPLNSSGLSMRDYMLIDAMVRKFAVMNREGGIGGGGMTVRVYIGDEELKDMVRYEVVENQTGLARDLAIGRRRY